MLATSAWFAVYLGCIDTRFLFYVCLIFCRLRLLMLRSQLARHFVLFLCCGLLSCLQFFGWCFLGCGLSMWGFITGLTRRQKIGFFWEFIPPADIEKSPQLMETLFYGISGQITSFNTIDKVTKGKLFQPHNSFEIVSDGGIIHYYAKVPARFQRSIESGLHSQYPDMEIRVVSEDYVDLVPKNIPNDQWELWGSDLRLVAPEAYPIRTYKYFQEDVTGKMIDPLASVLEVMSKGAPGEKIWVQYIIVPISEVDAKVYRSVVDDITGRSAPAPEGGEQPLEFRLTPGEKQVLKAVEENLTKNLFSVKARFMYVAPKPVFDMVNVAGFFGALKQFADQDLNGLAPLTGPKTASDYFPSLKLFRQRRLFNRYKGRSPAGNKIVLSTEELASLYHFPDVSVVTPTLERIHSRRSGPPSNLPIQ